MKKLILALFTLLSINTLQATPSRVFWTPCTTQVLETGDIDLNIDTYLGVDRRHDRPIPPLLLDDAAVPVIINPCDDTFPGPFRRNSFPTDVGLLIGILSVGDLSIEVGADYIADISAPFFFNAKFGLPEDFFFCNSPSFSFGVFGVGTRTTGFNRTNLNVLDFVLGKTIPDPIGGTIYAGGYSGSHALLRDVQGYMFGYERYFWHTVDCHGTEFYRWVLSGDWASGKNLIGGGGVSLTYYFTPLITLQTGPVWFNSSEILGNWKWGIQLDYIFPVIDWRKCN